MPVAVATPDPKPAGRHVEDRDGWEQIVLEKAGPCRGCEGQAQSFHHLVPRSLRGDDTAANVVPLCGHGTTGCHGALENHTGGWEQIAHAVRHSLSPLELQYIVAKKSRSWLDRYYPAGEAGLCERCKRPKRSQEPRSAPRRRKRWIVTVPDDGEDGAAVLDGLVDAARPLVAEALDYAADVPAYFVLSAVLADWLSQDKAGVA